MAARLQRRERRRPTPRTRRATATDEEEEASALSSPQKSTRAAAPAAKAKPKAEPEESDEAGARGESEGSSASAEVSKHGRPKLVMEKEQEAPASGALPPPAALELGVGGMALFRQLAWTSDARAAGLGPYKLTPGPAAGVWLEFYPASFATGGFVANLGLFVRYDYGFGVSTTLANGADVGTKYQDFLAGLKLRIRSGRSPPISGWPSGEQGFRLDPQGTPQDLPAMDYTFVRIGAGTRVQFTPAVEMDVDGAFLSVMDPGSAAGQVASAAFFPRAKAYAIDFGASLAVRITSAIGVRAGANLRQYGLSFQPQSGDARFVSGAVDCYIVAFAGMEVVLDGQRPGPVTSSEEAPEEGEAPPPKRRAKAAESDEEQEN